VNNYKAQQREQLVLEFGILIQPFIELGSLEVPPDISKYRIASAKVQAGDPKWRLTAKKYCTFADDIFMSAEFQEISHINEVFLRAISSLIDPDRFNNLASLQSKCNEEIDHLKGNFKDFASEIPMDWEPEIFPANTPFTSYLKIKESMALVNERIHYFDRYLKLEFFETFLRNIDRSKEIRLVTTAGKNDFGVKGVLSVSELARNEFQNYQLIEVSYKDIHDRNLRVDDSVFTLGPSIDRAGMCLTNFGPSDNSSTALQHLNEIIGNGNVIHQS